MIAGKAPWTYSPLCLLLITQGTVWTCQTRASAKRTSHAGITTPSVNAVPASPMAVVMATKTTLRRNSSVLSPVMGSPVSVMAFGGWENGEGKGLARAPCSVQGLGWSHGLFRSVLRVPEMRVGEDDSGGSGALGSGKSQPLVLTSLFPIICREGCVWSSAGRPHSQRR